MLSAVLACVLVGLVSRGAAQQCGGVLRAPTSFSSPAYPQNYSSNLHCEWEIITERGIRVFLQFVDQFAVERATNCSKDAVVIYDWKEDSYTEIERLCGTDRPYWYKSTFNKMKVVLKTDSEINLNGFQAKWTASCGGEYLATDTEQFIYSPGYPNYWPNMSCVYRIGVSQETLGNVDKNVAHKKKGRFNFVNFDLEDKSLPLSTCINDFVLLQYNFINEVNCGVEIISEQYFNDYLYVHFASNGAVEKKGFVISYSIFKCGGRITEPTTITPSSLARYPGELNCTWTIEAPENKRVFVKFAYLNLNVGLSCEKMDHITLYEGLLIDPDKQIALICGSTNSPVTVPAPGNAMTVMFETVKEGRGFSMAVIFADLEPTGCGGLFNVTHSTSFDLTSPNITSKNHVAFHCKWNILAPEDKVIKVQFTSLFLPECTKESDQNFLEIRDGLMPDSLLLGSYCGISLPQAVSSSSGRLSITLSSVTTSKFSVKVTVEKSLCEPTFVKVTKFATRLVSLGYESESTPRGINCAFEFQYTTSPIQLTIKNLDIQPGTTPGVCNKDKVIIGQRSGQKTLGKDYSLVNRAPFYYSVPLNPFFLESRTLVEEIFDFSSVNLTHQYEFCGSHDTIELYLPTSFYLNLITTSENVSRAYKGLEIQVTLPNFCNRNYTEPYGRIVNDVSYNRDTEDNLHIFPDRYDCFTLITAPEGYTISAYFMTFPYVYPRASYKPHMDIYDGNTTAARKLNTLKSVFSTGRYLLLHNIRFEHDGVHFDLNYMTTNKGQGCGGYLFNDQGMVTSPLYPQYHGGNKTCEWKLETPPGTRLRLWLELYGYGDCDENHIRLVNRHGQLVKKLCGSVDDEYISTDNYINIQTIPTEFNTLKWRAWFFNVSAK